MWPDHCLQNQFGSEFQKDLVVKDTDIKILKGKDKMVESYSGFGNEHEDTGLTTILKEKGVGVVYSCGLAYDYCVGSTAISAQEAGFTSILLSDATRHVADPTAAIMKEKLKEAGVREIESKDI